MKSYLLSDFPSALFFANADIGKDKERRLKSIQGKIEQRLAAMCKELFDNPSALERLHPEIEYNRKKLGLRKELFTYEAVEHLAFLLQEVIHIREQQADVSEPPYKKIRLR